MIDKSETPTAPEAAAVPSRGFLKDLLSDADGISLHCFQLFVWTLVLGVIFIASVYKNLAMPEFSTTLPGLMGISPGGRWPSVDPSVNGQQPTLNLLSPPARPRSP